MNVTTSNSAQTVTSLHVYWSAPYQPLTKYTDVHCGHTFITNPRKRYRCHECNQLRWAKNLVIRVEYDSLRVKCKESDHGGAWI